MRKNKLILVTILVLLFLLSISTIVQAASFPTAYTYEAQNYNSENAQASGGYSSTKGAWAFTIKGSSFSAPSDLQGMNSKKQKYYYGVICLQHGDSFKNSGKDTVVGRVQFYETNMKVTNYKTNKSTTYKYSSSSAPGKYGATVAYLLTYTGKTVSTGLAKNGENYLSKTQWLIWYMRNKGVLDNFYNGLNLNTKDMTSSSWPYVSGKSFGSSDATTKAEIESIYEVATTYQSFVKNYEEPEVVKSPADATNPIKKDNSGNLTIGPCKITYTSASKNDVKLGGLVSKTLYYEDTSGTTKTLSSSNYKIVNSSGETISIPSGENFYIYISADVVEKYSINTITKLDVQYRKVVCTGDVFFMDSGSSSQLWMVVGTAKIAYKNTTLTLPINSDANTYISLQINKIDATSRKAIEGIGFTIKDNSSEEYIDEDGNHVGEPVTIYTDANGQINISNISLNSKNTTFTVQEVESKNLYYKADTSIKKDNVSVSGDTATVTITNEKPYSLTIQKSDPDEQKTNLTAKFVIRYDGMSTESGDGDTSYSGDNLNTDGDETIEDNTTENSSTDEDSTDEGLTEDETIGGDDITDEWLTVASDGTVSYSSSKSAITVENGTLTIKGIKRGVYHIYEVEAPSGYDITMQDGYDSLNNWVDCGTAFVGIDNSGNQDNNSCSITVNKDNKRYVKIAGYVWEEAEKKSDVINEVYDGNDSKVQGATVQLVDKAGNVLATTKTDENGEYIFETLSNGDKIVYSNLSNYRVQFLYNKEKYVSVALNENVNVTNASRAIEDDKPQVQDEEDGTIGYARTSANGTLANYYNEKTYTVETINFGMMEKPTEDYTIKETMEYVKITKGDYAFKYTIGDSESGDEYTDAEKALLSTVNSQISTKPTFTQSLYPSDIAYNKSNNFSDDSSDKYRVYVVYKISVTNNASTSYYQYGNESLDLHDEDILYLSSLTNTYNQLIDNYTDEIDKYELDGTINDDVDTDEVKAEIGNWEEGQSTSDYDTANYTGEKYEKEGIAATKTVSTYIQFRITDEALYKLVNLSNEDRNWFINCASEAIANGYHGYYRDDWYWNSGNAKHYNNCYHTTKITERTASALFLKLKLKDTRTVSGTVFEDKAIESTLENSGERLGDGQYAVDENTLSDVVVSLMNAEDNTVAKLYVWEDGNAVSKDATVKVEGDGTYKLEGMVPGKYYLQYVYGNGTVEYTDINGNLIGNIDTTINGEVIDANDYKSTILTGNAKDTNGNENGWFIDNGTYNIATDTISTDASGNEEDIITARTTSDDEMYNATVENREAITITAQSPEMDINFEYVENKEIAISEAGSLNTDLGGMCFGIIERAHTDVTLEKEISNVKLTLQNGTVIINGNPKDSNVSKYLVDLDGSSTYGSQYAKIEIDSNMLYGSTAEVTYKVTVTNESDVDYATEGYYTKGEDKTNLVETIATKIVDYVSNGTTYTSLDSTEFSGDEALETMNGITESEYFTEEAIKASKEFNKMLITSEKKLKPTKAVSEDEIEDKSQEIHTITVSKTLNTADDDMGETTYAEIIGLKNITFTPQYESISGNYELGDDEATEETTNEADDASSILAISPSTGENNSYTVYIFTGVMLIIFATGLIVIKKYVL